MDDQLRIYKDYSGSNTVNQSKNSHYNRKYKSKENNKNNVAKNIENLSPVSSIHSLSLNSD